MTAEQAIALKEKLKLLSRIDKSRQLFGAGRHNYELAPCIPEAEIVAFEKKIGTTLPENVRNMLLYFGSGGPGPGLGMPFIDLKKDYPRFNFRKPFPGSAAIEAGIDASIQKSRSESREKIINQFGKLLNEKYGSEKIEQSSYEDFLHLCYAVDEIKEELNFEDAESDLKEERLNRYEFAPLFEDKNQSAFDGLLPVVFDGCGYFDCIVINGNDKGAYVYCNDDGRITVGKSTLFKNFDDWIEAGLKKARDAFDAATDTENPPKQYSLITHAEILCSMLGLPYTLAGNSSGAMMDCYAFKARNAMLAVFQKENRKPEFPIPDAICEQVQKRCDWQAEEKKCREKPNHLWE